MISTALPIPADAEPNFYFEVELIDAGPKQMVGIGLHPSGSICGMVGWQPNSYGYHADDGSLRNAMVSHVKINDNVCRTGDVMGCGWKKELGLVYFTRNGVVIGAFNNSPKGPLHLVVTGESASVRTYLIS